MTSKKELFKNTLIISIGKFSTKIVSFLLLPLYTSILTTSEYGEYDLLNMLSIFLIPCITLQMEEAMFRFLIDAKDSDDKTVVLSKTIIFCTISSIIWTILILIIGNILNYQYTLYLALFCISSVVYAIASSFCRGEGNYKLYSLLAFISSLLNIILNILFLAVFNFGLSGMFISYIISTVLVGIYGLYKLKINKYIKKTNDKKTTKEMIKYCLPLVPGSVSYNLISFFNRLIIKSNLGVDMNGIYSVSNKFPTIINTCYSFFNTSWREGASKALKGNDYNEFYNDVYNDIKNLLLGISILMISMMPLVFNILVNSSFSNAYYYIPIITIAIYYTNMSQFISGIYSAYKDTKILGPTTILASIICILFNILLIDKIGLYAPTFGTLIAYFIIYIIRKINVKKYFHFKHSNKLLLNIFITIVVTIIYYSNSLALYILGSIIGISYFILLNYKFIKNIILSIKKR